jgi:hypothetical protein
MVCTNPTVLHLNGEYTPNLGKSQSKLADAAGDNGETDDDEGDDDGE